MMTVYNPRIRNLLASVPDTRNPELAIVSLARKLVLDSGAAGPPYEPQLFAELRGVKQVVEREMKIDGRLVPHSGGFTIELRKDRALGRKNFTCAHEVAHTFFYGSERISSLTFAAMQQTPDQQEERLCDIAAAELMMPALSMKNIASDYSPSSTSLHQVALIFHTSTVATAIRVLQLGIWSVGFVMWQIADGELRPQWICKKNGALSYDPVLNVLDRGASGIYHTLKTGERTVSWELLQTDGGTWPSRVESIRLTPHRILTTIGVRNNEQRVSISNSRSTSPMLPVEYSCQCGGAGWILSKQESRTVAARCLAARHESKRTNDEHSSNWR